MAYCVKPIIREIWRDIVWTLQNPEGRFNRWDSSESNPFRSLPTTLTSNETGHSTCSKQMHEQFTFTMPTQGVLIGHMWDSIRIEVEFHDDVIKWKHFPRYWPFVRGIHRWPVTSPHKGQWRGALIFSLICALSKQWWGGWFETPLRPLWRQCNVDGWRQLCLARLHPRSVETQLVKARVSQIMWKW